jgi:hypothetical protein
LTIISHESVLLRKSYRANGKVKKQTVANLCEFSRSVIANIQLALRGEQFGAVGQFTLSPLRS